MFGTNRTRLALEPACDFCSDFFRDGPIHRRGNGRSPWLQTLRPRSAWSLPPSGSVWGLVTSVTAGFTVQVAQRIGAKQFDEARSVLRQSLFVGGLISIAIAIVGVALAPYVPTWLGGAPELYADAKTYFAIFCLGTPAAFLGFVASSMLRSTGNVNFRAC